MSNDAGDSCDGTALGRSSAFQAWMEKWSPLRRAPGYVEVEAATQDKQKVGRVVGTEREELTVGDEDNERERGSMDTS